MEEITLQKVEARMRAVTQKVGLSPGVILAFNYLTTIIDPALGGPRFDKDFGDFLAARVSAKSLTAIRLSAPVSMTPRSLPRHRGSV